MGFVGISVGRARRGGPPQGRAAPRAPGSGSTRSSRPATPSSPCSTRRPTAATPRRPSRTGSARSSAAAPPAAAADRRAGAGPGAGRASARTTTGEHEAVRPDAAPLKAELGAKPTGSIRVDVDRLDEIAALAGDVLVEGARSIRRSRELNGAVRPLGAPLRPDHRARRAAARRARPRSSSSRSRATSTCSAPTPSASPARRPRPRRPRRRSSGMLAERIGNARLIPLSGVLAGFPRAARDMAQEQGKEVECVVQGRRDRASTRRSCSRSTTRSCTSSATASTTASRRRRSASRPGKPRIGRIVLAARTDGDLLAVTVEDDGRGIAPQKVRAAALKKGIIGEQQAASLSARAALDLIFTPGFSTREQAGETSGRGVGLDVVRKRVTALGGSVTVESEPGKGAAVHAADAAVALAHEGAARPDRRGRVRHPGGGRGQRGAPRPGGHHRGGGHPGGALPRPAHAGGGARARSSR